MLLTTTLVILVVTQVGTTSLCRPVFVIPGIFDFPLGNTVCYTIRKYSPNATCIYLQPGGIFGSTISLTEQVKVYQQILIPYFEKYADGVDIIGFSQGSLIADGVIKSTANHTVKSFLSIAGPVMGIFGMPKIGLSLNIFQNSLFWTIALPFLHRFLYKPKIQKRYSIANFWHDPLHETEFRDQNIHLPKFLNMIKHPDKDDFKTNFLKLEKLVYIVGSEDITIVPFISTLGGFYNKELIEEPLETQEIYINDTFGLQTLDNDSRFKRIIAKGYDHFTVVQHSFIQEYILPELAC